MVMMAILPRKLLSQTTGNSINTTTLCYAACEPGSDGQNYCAINCSTLPSPASPPKQNPSLQSHIMPYLIATVCVLGVAFLLISTCTILLRNRWVTRRRNNSIRVVSSNEDFLDNDHGTIDYPIWHIVTVGLQQSVIDSITAFKYKRSDGLFEGNDCSVCLTEFGDGDDLRLLPKCSHAFHVSCIDTWLRSHKNCPLCRAPIVSEPPPGAPVTDSGDPNPVELTLHMDDLRSLDVGSQRIQGGQTSELIVRERSDPEIDSLAMEGARKIAEVLKKNGELRAVLSDLGDGHRPGIGGDHHIHVLRRSASLDALAASVISDAMAAAVACSSVLVKDQGAGCSEQEKSTKEGDSSCRLRESSSIGCSSQSQKAPVSSVKRSVSSSIFSSFRRSKSQISSLPLNEDRETSAHHVHFADCMYVICSTSMHTYTRLIFCRHTHK
ncbi:hypothetical protein Dimus_017782 [Dionaea muscipula]